MTDQLIERATRTCVKCGRIDSHSHHVQYVAFIHPVTGQGEDLSVSKHVQCCAEDDCPICSVDVEFARQVLDARDIDPSDAFTDYMQAKPRELLQALFERTGIETPDFQLPRMGEEE